MIIYIKGRAI